MKTRIAAFLLCLTMLLSGCGGVVNNDSTGGSTDGGATTDPTQATTGSTADLGDDNKTFGSAIEDTGAYNGYFEGESKDIDVKFVSGTNKAYKLDGTTLTFTAISADTVYSISGTFKGNIVIDVGDTYKFDLELNGFSIVCDSQNPITIKSGDEVSIKAKKDTKNYIYDMRDRIDSASTTLYSGAIHSEVDLEISGKGELFVVSENNNGIHTKDDLQVKNVTLFVAAIDNSLKGNDSVEIEDANTTLIASGGDCIKTSNSDISSKGNQRGSVTLSGGTHTLYAACDGIDAAYNVVINDESTSIDIYTDKYSSYSNEVTVNSETTHYIRFTTQKYYYSVKYYNSDTDYVWVNAEYHSAKTSGKTTYYYYSYPNMPEYTKQQFFIYEKESQMGQGEVYAGKTDYLTTNSGCDTISITSSGTRWSYYWTNYETKTQTGGFGGFGGFGGGFGGGPGGMMEGNSDKGDYSTKGIKASNEIIINAGTLNIKSYDDAIHANNDTALENGASPLGNVTVNGGVITIYTNDDGIHADSLLKINSGTVNITKAYEGLEGSQVVIAGGDVSILSSDDGINATLQSGTAIEISGGNVYIYCTGDGIDSNSRASYSGIVFSGGNTVVISNSNMNSAIDSENGYAYTGGSVVAIMPNGGMSNESTHCKDLSSVGLSKKLSLSKGSYLVVGIKDKTVTIEMPLSLTALVVVLGDSSASVSTQSSSSQTLTENGVAWN